MRDLILSSSPPSFPQACGQQNVNINVNISLPSAATDHHKQPEFQGHASCTLGNTNQGVPGKNCGNCAHEKVKRMKKKKKKRKSVKRFCDWNEFMNHRRECLRAKRQMISQQLGLEEHIVELFVAPTPNLAEGSQMGTAPLSL